MNNGSYVLNNFELTVFYLATATCTVAVALYGYVFVRGFLDGLRQCSFADTCTATPAAV
jgi:hypothetical protein